MYCKKCGTEIIEGNKFCVKCGASVQDGEVKVTTDSEGKPAAGRGVVDKVMDKVIEKATGQKTVPLSVDQLTELISDIYIKGASEKEKELLRKTIKGAFFRISLLASRDGKYTLHVSEYNIYYAPLNIRTVWIKDNEEGLFYELAKRRWYSKLKHAVCKCI